MMSSVGIVKGAYAPKNGTFRITRTIARPLNTAITSSDSCWIESAAPRHCSRYACQAIAATIAGKMKGALFNGVMSISGGVLEAPYHEAAAPTSVTSQTARARGPLNIELAGSDPRPNSADAP